MRPKARLMPGFFLLGAIWQKRGHRKKRGLSLCARSKIFRASG
jgi:hypothetical protein